MKLSYINLNDRKEVKRAIDLLEYVLNENADSKAADTSEPEPIITQNEEPFKPVIWTPDVDSALSVIGLKLSDCNDGGSPSANVIACKHNIMGNVDELGLNSLITASSVLKQAWPHGGQKWNWKIVRDVWYFCSRAEAAGYDIQIDKFANRLSKCVVNDNPITEKDFMKMIHESGKVGLASLTRYNQGLAKHRIHEEILDQEVAECH